MPLGVYETRGEHGHFQQGRGKGDEGEEKKEGQEEEEETQEIKAGS